MGFPIQNQNQRKRKPLAKIKAQLAFRFVMKTNGRKTSLANMLTNQDMKNKKKGRGR